MKRIVLTITLIAIISCVFAQNETDALRFSRTYFGGTSRSMSMGGAFGALGGDISTLSFNPAGIAVYRHTELSFTPILQYTETKSEFFMDGTSAEEYKYEPGIQNPGIVVSFNIEEPDGWKNVNTGFAYNRLRDFNSNTTIKGRNYNSSIVDIFANNARETSPDDLWAYSERLAYDTWLIDDIDNTDYEYSVALSTLGQFQEKISETKGSIGEYDFSLGANYNHKVYLGLTFGIFDINYNETSYYTETDDLDIIDDFQSMYFEEKLHISGTGFNIKLGVIYKPFYWFRFGAAFHSPVFYTIEDKYDTYMSSVFDTPDPDGYYSYSAYPCDNYGDYLGTNFYEYKLTTPIKALASMAFVIDKKAIVSIDYEITDYSKANMSADGDSFSAENDNIESNYSTAHNLKAGTELRLGIVSLRGGYAYYGSPYSDSQQRKGDTRNDISCGIGISRGNFYFDAAYLYSSGEYSQFLYDTYSDYQELVGADMKNTTSRFMITIGCRI